MSVHDAHLALPRVPRTEQTEPARHRNERKLDVRYERAMLVRDERNNVKQKQIDDLDIATVSKSNVSG